MRRCNARTLAGPVPFLLGFALFSPFLARTAEPAAAAPARVPANTLVQRTVPAVFRPTTGAWALRGLPGATFGRRGDQPVPADYNGDGRTDIAVWRPTTGTWLLRGLPDATFGRRGDQPVPADYDGNSTTDIAVWRPTTGTWFVRGLPSVTWGRSGDVPVRVATPSTVAAPFHAVVTAAPAARMRSSWRAGCPVPIRDLRLLTVTHVGFDRLVHRGELVVHRAQADRLAGVFHQLYDARFPIRRIRLVDEYGGSDDRSMSDDNTSAFNCRAVTGRPGVWSQHSYGWAVDINPFENPYVSGSTVLPREAARYADRSRRDRGMIHAGDATVKAFGSIGWRWGGSWRKPKDYQHFSVTGR
ncbi:MAG TPA: M15 family metallopeptidase [Actinomycetales bacterium]|nr:M15 family metallopeptidase [Actinomycetales bacterium]